MKIEFLYSDDCPNEEPAYSLLESVVENLVPGTTIEKVKISSNEEATKHAFYGSPSIHVNGVDLEQDANRLPVMSCRIYDAGGVPPQWLIEVGIIRALNPRGILFLCVANSARSQIAEGIARQIASPEVLIQSAGSMPTMVRPEATTVLLELGIDTSAHRSKIVDDIDPATVDTVITLCGEEECPVFLGDAIRIHWGLPDPASVNGNDEDHLSAFRKTREELHKRLSVVFGAVDRKPDEV